MIKERYCSYEVARLLKEKGFSEPVRSFYLIDDAHSNAVNVTYTITYRNVNSAKAILRPTHQMACDWLREVHYICITIYPDNEKGFEAVFYDIESDVEITLQSFGIYDFHIFGNSYEEAVEAAIKYSLENLV